MKISSALTKFTIPWGNSAGSSYIRTIPSGSQIATTPGAASLADGFPPICSLPIAAGGTPPFMQDMNGILNVITAWLQWYQAGGAIAYDSTFQAAVGGYPSGAIIQSGMTPGLLWRSIIDNNTTNPDTGGLGWVNANSGRLINVKTWVTAGTYIYAPTAGTQSVIVTVLGGGGAGGGVQLSSGGYGVGSGGASGSVGKSRLTSGFSNLTIVVGAGGTPVSGWYGNPGGTSSFGNLVSAPGGGGGLSFAAATLSGFSGQGIPGTVASGGNIINVAGQPGPNGLLQGVSPMSGQGAPSIFGGGGSNVPSGPGSAGGAPGSGGSGAAADASHPGPYAGGPGIAGAIIIEEYA